MRDLISRIGQPMLPNSLSLQAVSFRGVIKERIILMTWSVLVIWLSFEMILPDVAIAQDTNWNPPVQLHSTENMVYDPILLSDDSGRLHLFWSEVSEDVGETAGQSQIYYMVKDGDSWSGPVDVLTVPRGFTNGLRGSVDEFGRPYLVIGGSNSILQYSRAFQPEAMTALAWQPLRGLTDLQVGGEIYVADAIHVIYADIGGQIIYLRLGENGNVESSQVIAWLPGNQVFIRPPRMIQVSDGTLHVILPAITPPAGDLDAYYIRSTDQGETWSELMSISQPDLLAIAIEESSNSNLNILYIGRAGVGGRYHSLSEDGGDSWSELMPISLPSEGSGMSGGDLDIDSAGRLHAVLGLADGTTIVHSEFDGSNWHQSEPIGQGVGSALENMELEITRGNQLHAVWQSDHNSIWYAEGFSSALPVEPSGVVRDTQIDVLPVTSIDSPELADVQPLSNSPNSLNGSALQSPPADFSNVDSLLIAVGASLVFIVLVVIFHRMVNRR